MARYRGSRTWQGPGSHGSGLHRGPHARQHPFPAPIQGVVDVCDRGPLWVQPHHGGNVRRRPVERRCPRHPSRRSAARCHPRILRSGGAAGLDLVLDRGNRVHARRAVHRPDVDHAPVQHVHSARRRRVARRHPWIRPLCGLPARGHLCRRRLTEVVKSERILHGFWKAQAHRAVRHPRRRVHRRGAGGGGGPPRSATTRSATFGGKWRCRSATSRRCCGSCRSS